LATFYERFELLRVAYGLITDYYQLFTSHLRENQSMVTRDKNFDMSKKLPVLSRILSPYECLRVVPSYLRIPASYLRMLAIDS